jgi:hypothetical protein
MNFDAAIDQLIETSILDELDKSLNDELKCEYQHHHPGGLTPNCSIVAVAIVTSCVGEGLWCQSCQDKFLESAYRAYCHYCKRSVLRCWKTVPIT